MRRACKNVNYAEDTMLSDAEDPDGDASREVRRAQHKADDADGEFLPDSSQSSGCSDDYLQDPQSSQISKTLREAEEYLHPSREEDEEMDTDGEEDNDGGPRIHTPTLDFAGGKLDAYKLGRIILSRRSWLQEHGQPIGAWRVTVAALYELKSPHTEWLWTFMNTHWPDMRLGEVTQEKAEEWYDMAVQEWHESLPSTQGSLEDLYA
ncbi:hypothetical protein C8Q74DRAFT_1444881 [Fomes fomentarius]|nr:hypothetical protein C8Q74DRAFT_1444881 [Fomes fomentarius]